MKSFFRKTVDTSKNINTMKYLASYNGKIR